MNKLDDKVIVDREKLESIIQTLTSCNSDYAVLGNQRGMTYTMDAIQILEAALSADLTGWAAVPVVQTQEMLDAGKNEYQMVLATFGSQYKFDAIGEAYRAMLAASPPLPGGGE